ncbi:BRCT domain-containing protein [Atopomonas sediminilitoris]|uniref:BRCT domain-containing protein n=1 Tax=Atopomonas sediminilitoris TaxID=2919919 RepID=UPI001F4E493A|nr:BRCT domain-containing protein [Atopomonas sediminilitoris]MCJ8168656.1 BRCT domain-containing protein [Atopomonas sediminilitoris]
MVDLHQEFENSRFFHKARIDRRAADTLLGLAAGMAADGTINQQEAEFLKNWIESNLAHADDPVINILYRRLTHMLSDQLLDADESAELLDMLKQLTGTSKSPDHPHQAPSTLPLNHPAPPLALDCHTFVFTGVMAYGPRAACEALVRERGGLIGSGISKKTNYLVVGSIGNEQWLHSSYGNKIKKAVELREAGNAIAIISEDHWQQTIFS